MMSEGAAFGLKVAEGDCRTSASIRLDAVKAMVLLVKFAEMGRLGRKGRRRPIAYYPRLCIPVVDKVC